MTQSNQIQIIAAGITTLDEARYFAAMGVDWLGFNILHLPVDDIKTISDWVVGPNVFVELSELEGDQLFEITNKMQLHGICLPQLCGLPEWYHGRIIRHLQFPPTESELIAMGDATLWLTFPLVSEGLENTDTLNSLCQSHTCWIEYDLNLMSTSEICKIASNFGIVLRCQESTGSVENTYEGYEQFFDEMEKIRNHDK